MRFHLPTDDCPHLHRMRSSIRGRFPGPKIPAGHFCLAYAWPPSSNPSAITKKEHLPNQDGPNSDGAVSLLSPFANQTAGDFLSGKPEIDIIRTAEPIRAYGQVRISSAL